MNYACRCIYYFFSFFFLRGKICSAVLFSLIVRVIAGEVEETISREMERDGKAKFLARQRGASRTADAGCPGGRNDETSIHMERAPYRYKSNPTERISPKESGCLRSQYIYRYNFSLPLMATASRGSTLIMYWLPHI